MTRPRSTKSRTWRSSQAKPIANSQLTPADVYLATILQKQGKEALDAHCIPTLSCPRRLTDIRILEYRRVALAQAINDFITSKAGSPQEIDLGQVIRAGEVAQGVQGLRALGLSPERSKQSPGETVICKTVAGLSNGKGGTLLIGVDDNGKVLGLVPDYTTLSKRQDCDGYQQFLVNLLSTSLGKEACANLSISFASVEGKDVLIIKVPKGTRPVYVADGQHTKFYLRTGNTTQELTTKESIEYVNSRWP